MDAEETAGAAQSGGRATSASAEAAARGPFLGGFPGGGASELQSDKMAPKRFAGLEWPAAGLAGLLLRGNRLLLDHLVVRLVGAVSVRAGDLGSELALHTPSMPLAMLTLCQVCLKPFLFLGSILNLRV